MQTEIHMINKKQIYKSFNYLHYIHYSGDSTSIEMFTK